jgi:hypothetical protein
MNKTILTLITSALAMVSAIAKQPNIVFIMADDLGFETIAANGGTSYKTPNLNLAFSLALRRPLATGLKSSGMRLASQENGSSVERRTHLSTLVLMKHCFGNTPVMDARKSTAKESTNGTKIQFLRRTGWSWTSTMANTPPT